MKHYLCSSPQSLGEVPDAPHSALSSVYRIEASGMEGVTPCAVGLAADISLVTGVSPVLHCTEMKFMGTFSNVHICPEDLMWM